MVTTLKGRILHQKQDWQLQAMRDPSFSVWPPFSQECSQPVRATQESVPLLPTYMIIIYFQKIIPD